MVEILKRYFNESGLIRTTWKHDECVEPIVTYASKTTGEALMFFLSEDGKGRPTFTSVKSLMAAGWEREQETSFPLTQNAR